MFVVLLRGVKTQVIRSQCLKKRKLAPWHPHSNWTEHLDWVSADTGQDCSSRPRPWFPKHVGATCFHKQLYLRNRNFNWLKLTVWNLEWKLGSPPPQHLYFGLWIFGRTAGSINWLLVESCVIHLCTIKKDEEKPFLVLRKSHKR